MHDWLPFHSPVPHRGLLAANCFRGSEEQQPVCGRSGTASTAMGLITATTSECT